MTRSTDPKISYDETLNIISVVTLILSILGLLAAFVLKAISNIFYDIQPNVWSFDGSTVRITSSLMVEFLSILYGIISILAGLGVYMMNKSDPIFKISGWVILYQIYLIGIIRIIFQYLNSEFYFVFAILFLIGVWICILLLSDNLLSYMLTPVNLDPLNFKFIFINVATIEFIISVIIFQNFKVEIIIPDFMD